MPPLNCSSGWHAARHAFTLFDEVSSRGGESEACEVFQDLNGSNCHRIIFRCFGGVSLVMAITAIGILKNFTRLTLAALLVAAGCAPRGMRTSIRRIPGPHTRAERTAYKETSHYADVIAFIDSL